MVSYRQIYSIALPILISMLMTHLIGLCDIAFLGRVGEIALGAAALGSIFYLSFYMLGFGFSIGAQILIARRNGERKYVRIGTIFYTAFFAIMLLAVLLLAVEYWGGAWFLRFMVKSSEVRQATLDYMDYRVWGLPFAFASAMFRAFYVGITHTRILTLNSTMMLGTNALLNYALIFGEWGFPCLGIAGAAIASSASEAVSMIFYVIWTRYRVDCAKYALDKGVSRVHRQILFRVCSLSSWTMMQLFLTIFVWFFFFIAVEHQGERPLAVINLIRALTAIPFVFISSFATAGNTIISNMIGAQGPGEVLKTVWKVCAAAALAVLPALLLMAVAPALVLNIFTGDEILIAAATPVVYVAVIAQLLQWPANIWFMAISGTGNTNIVLYIELITLLLYTASIWLFIMELNGSPALAWGTEIVYQVVVLGLSLLYMYFGRWREKRI